MRSVLDRLKHEEVRLHQSRCETLPLTVYEGMYTYSPPRCYASPWIDHCVCIEIFWFSMQRSPIVASEPGLCVDDMHE